MAASSTFPSPFRRFATFPARWTGASHVARDITEHKNLEVQMRQTQRLESLGVLAGGIAHDFNNLLTGIIGNASLVTEMLAAQDPARPFLDNLLLASQRAADLTAQLLAYSGRGQFVVGPVNVSSVVSEVNLLIAASIPKTVSVHMGFDPDLPLVEADRNQMQTAPHEPDPQRRGSGGGEPARRGGG